MIAGGEVVLLLLSSSGAGKDSGARVAGECCQQQWQEGKLCLCCHHRCCCCLQGRNAHMAVGREICGRNAVARCIVEVVFDPPRSSLLFDAHPNANVDYQLIVASFDQMAAA